MDVELWWSICRVQTLTPKKDGSCATASHGLARACRHSIGSRSLSLRFTSSPSVTVLDLLLPSTFTQHQHIHYCERTNTRSHEYPSDRTYNMRFAIFSVLIALLVAYAAAVAPLKAVVISYPSDTPWSVLDEAKDAIRAAVRSRIPSCSSAFSVMVAQRDAPAA